LREPPAPLISVVIPVYNEEQTILACIRRVLAVPMSKQVVVVDDGSSDGTGAILRREIAPLGVEVIHLPTNRGKGAALRRGFEAARGEVTIVQDADLEYDPKDYPALLAPILDGQADVVFGSRFTSGARRVLFFWHHVGNQLLTTLSNALTNLNLSDMETGYKVFRTSILREIDLREDRFGFEPEFTAKIARQGYRIFEVPVSYRGRTYAEGKKVDWRDGLAALWCLFRYNVIRR
jgi:glycosyltransferase involved in cell wall biosynthesis